MTDTASDLRRSCERLDRENARLKEQLAAQKRRADSLARTVSHLRKAREEDRKKFEDEIAKKDAIIKGLKKELAEAKAIQNHDGTNTGMSTSRTPIGKDKVISNINSRQKSGRPKGGTPLHKKHSLDGTAVQPDIEETQVHPLEDWVHCPGCGGSDFSPTGESEVKYEYDVRINVVKIKHEFFYYRCNDCGSVIRSDIPPSLKEQHQYGSSLKAILLSLTNTANAAMNKAAMFLAGITGGRLTPCEGYIAKLQRKAAEGLMQFRSDLKHVLVTRKIIYWDDTVIFILTKRACFRFYGDERIAYYTAHEHKDLKSIEEDNVLSILTDDITVMHDHNSIVTIHSLPVGTPDQASKASPLLRQGLARTCVSDGFHKRHFFTRTADIPIRAGRQARFRIDADAMSVGFMARMLPEDFLNRIGVSRTDAAARRFH